MDLSNILYVHQQIIEISKISLKELSQSRLDRLSGYVDALVLNKLVSEATELEMRKDVNSLKMNLGLLIYGTPDLVTSSSSDEEMTRPQARA